MAKIKTTLDAIFPIGCVSTDQKKRKKIGCVIMFLIDVASKLHVLTYFCRGASYNPVTTHRSHEISNHSYIYILL